ncbi:hypothetical protein C9374_003560 [Naegleria lovaniensis]|uniref:Uncharacterized protein n=1 Tax=Naegleria lovaniensis TaxID=51637 RepID=A0AA88H4Y5_NAELO|nr:uncharacterized protein C9374_003560 [Naegleria lovaniensis]KAG2393796.1 hypothetical protein C9374_003560 [Naegleria lovaniensis]
MLYLRIENLCDAAEQKEEDECYEAFQLLHLSAATSYSSWLLEKKHHDNNSFENCTNDIFKSTINNVSKNNIINSNNNNTNSIMYECKRDQDQSVITKSHKYRKILKPIPTSFHSGCLVQNSQMNWFVYVSGCIQMSDHLVAVQVFDLDTRTWLEIFRFNGEDTDDDGADNISDENEDYEFEEEETPVQTWGHCACYSPLTKSLYVFGGAQDNDFQNDRLMEFSLKDCRWKWRRTRNECEFNDNTSPIHSKTGQRK